MQNGMKGRVADWQSADRLVVSRSLGGPEGLERLGVGFERKTGSFDYSADIDRCYDYYVLIYVIRGRARYELADGRSFPVEAGYLMQRIPGVTHSTITDPESDWAECYLVIGPQLYQAMVEMRIIRSDLFVYPMKPLSGVEDRFLALLESLDADGEERIPGVLLRVQSLLIDLLTRAGMPDLSESDLRMVEEACICFGATLHQRMDLKTFCTSRGWGYEKFRKVFREKQGMPPGQYILRRRMDKARQLLVSTDLQVSEIAYELGYSNLYEFSAQFKRHCSQSPAAYRRLQG